jgi:hypothetical protein
MKQKIICSVLSSVFSIAVLSCFGQQEKYKSYEHVKERNISKSYPASGNNLDIENSFGKVEVVTWAQNEIKIDVHIEVSSNDAAIAEKSINSITVTDNKSGNNIRFKTSISNNYNIKCNNCQNSMRIDYTIHLPTNTKLSIENSFGGITVPDYTGELDLHSKFGSLSAGALTSVKNIEVEFGTANIASLANVKAEFKYSTIEIGGLSGTNKLEIEFCNAAKIGLTNALTSISVNEAYSTINLRPASNLQATYNIRTSYGSLLNRSGITINRTDEPDEYGPDADKDYEGKSGNGAAKVNVKSSFGTVIIGEPKSGDIKEKKKNKNKEVDV